MRRMARLGAVLLLAGAPAAALGQVKADTAPALPAVLLGGLPEEIAGFRRGLITDFALRANDPGLGASVAYRPADGGVATVYVYDRGQRGLTNGEAEMRIALQEVAGVAGQQGAQVGPPRGLPEVAGPDGRPALRCTAFTLSFQDGRQANSYACTGVVRARYLKLRVTMPAGGAPPDARVAALAAGVVAAVRNAP